MEPIEKNTVIIQSNAQGERRWLRFDRPHTVFVVYDAKEIQDCLAQIERHSQQGDYVVGFLSYEAAAAFDSAYRLHACNNDLPLLWFACYRDPVNLEDEQLCAKSSYSVSNWSPGLVESEYQARIAEIKKHIKAGDSYQVNFTFALHSDFSGDAFAYFTALLRSQQASYCAYLDIGRYKICSLSPELFFAIDGDKIISKPMKGTIARGLHSQQDSRQCRALSGSTKERAENLMIVDMIRNDLGRIAATGSVQVDSMFDVEQYPTLHQMTSTVSATTSASVSTILKNIMPCASITGAPKIKTMEIIHRLETGPRGIYTGTIGYIAPSNITGKRNAQFNVAIRTAVIDSETNTAQYGVGSGVVWDSEPEREYRECLTKAAVLAEPVPRFELLESMRWDPVNQYYLLEQHLSRLEQTANYFGIAVAVNQIRQGLHEFAKSLTAATKVRLTVHYNSKFAISSSKLKSMVGAKVRLLREPMDTQNPFVYHKTTSRDFYRRALDMGQGCDDVLIVNRHGNVTEATTANLVLHTEDGLITPQQDCGLLAGVLRGHLLQHSIVQEARISVEQLRSADAVYLINSVRGWMRLTPVANDTWEIVEVDLMMRIKD